MRVPQGLHWWRDEEPGGGPWLDRLPRLVEECAERWSLTLEPPFEPASVSLVVPGTMRDGTGVVLKVNYPEPESEQEADALRQWGGHGAVRLVADDPERRALLIERCEPGDQLWSVADEDEANLAAAEVFRRIWRQPPPGHPYRALADLAAGWADEIPRRWRELGRPFERALLERATAFLDTAPQAGAGDVLLHQDMHGGNVLRSGGGWLAIDPKPLVGDRAFDLASILRDRRPELMRDPGAARRIRHRFDLLTAELELDRELVQGWAVVHALAWSMDDPNAGADEAMVACARWLAEI